jgi:hypothetical protein
MLVPIQRPLGPKLIQCEVTFIDVSEVLPVRLLRRKVLPQITIGNKPNVPAEQNGRFIHRAKEYVWNLSVDDSNRSAKLSVECYS